MKSLTFNLYEIGDIVGREGVEQYHDAWKTWNFSHKQKERKTLVQCAQDEKVVLGEIFTYKKYNGKEIGMKRGEVYISRARVFQDDLRKTVNPYGFGKETKYIYPFWHEYHMWQAGEQLTHGTRSKISVEEQTENYELIITPKSVFNIKSHIFFHQEISIELIWHKKGKIVFKGDTNSIEDFYFSIYDGNNECLANVNVLGFTKPRIWRILSQKVAEGDCQSKQELIDKLLIQRKYLDKIKRTPPYNTQDLIQEIERGQIDPKKFEDFFSMWDLN